MGQAGPEPSQPSKEPEPVTPSENPWKIKIAKYWKFAIAFIGALIILFNVVVGQDVWGPTATKWLNAIIAFLVAIGVFLVKNTDAVETITGIDIDQDKDIGVPNKPPVKPPPPPAKPPEG